MIVTRGLGAGGPLATGGLGFGVGLAGAIAAIRAGGGSVTAIYYGAIAVAKVYSGTTQVL